jgi:hypothetical protein
MRNPYRTVSPVPAARTALLLLVLVVATSCSGAGDGDPTASATTASSPRPSSSATLTIASPKQNAVITGSTAPVQVKLVGGKIVPQTSTDLVPNEGHLHLILDDRLVSMTSGTSSTLTGLTPGEHLLKVEFVAKDHAPFDPRVIVAVSFEVKA